MIVATLAVPGSPPALLERAFRALSTRFGGETGPLDEPAVFCLVELARDGDRFAGQRLYRQYVDLVFRTVRGMLQSDADAEDVTQDTMLTVLTSLEAYAPRTDTRFSAWVTAIALNTARRRFRRRRPGLTATGELPEREDEAADPERDAVLAEQRDTLLAALTELDSREREIVSLRYGAELNASEIADLTSLTPANVRKILERARSRLFRYLEGFTDGDPQ